MYFLKQTYGGYYIHLRIPLVERGIRDSNKVFSFVLRGLRSWGLIPNCTWNLSHLPISFGYLLVHPHFYRRAVGQGTKSLIMNVFIYSEFFSFIPKQLRAFSSTFSWDSLTNTPARRNAHDSSFEFNFLF